MKKLIAYFATGNGHTVGVFKSYAFSLGIESAGRIFGEVINLLVGDSQLAANGSVDVLSKLTVIERSHATVKQRSQTGLY